MEKEEEVLTLNDNDPRVLAARQAEKELFDFYGLRATDHYIRLPKQGIRVRVSEIGSGEPLVIVPGNTGMAFPLASLLAQLPGRRLIAINRPGGGLSEGIDHNTVDIRQFAVETLATVLAASSLENVDVVAHSMGAHWSLLLAMDRPQLVRRLVLLGNPGNVMQGQAPLALRLLVKPPFTWLFSRLLPTRKDQALRLLRRMGHSAHTLAQQPPGLGDSYFYFQQLPNYLISTISLLQNMVPQLEAQQLKSVSQPTLLLLGTNDTFASIETGQRIVAALPNGEFHAIAGAGHLPWLESPEECGRLIQDFLAKE